MTKYLRIGLVLKPQGIKGELKVLPLTDDPRRFTQLKEIYLEGAKGGYEKRALLSANVREDAVYCAISGVEDRNAAETLRNRYLCVDRENAVKLSKDRYFVCDIIGCSVWDSSGNPLGILEEVLQTGANDVYAIRQENGKSVLVPALKKLLVLVDIDEKRIVLDAEVMKEVALYED
ncbi:MAG: ribosome maturation factor RimM [Christensenellales bacterium]|jgi:16S rRNA processing protein RimM